MYVGGRIFNEEQAFLAYDHGYKYVLKEKPNLDSLTILARRDRTKKKTGCIALGIIGFFTIPLFLIGLILMMASFEESGRIDYNNTAPYECVYYNREKNTVIFRTIIEKLWLEFDIERVIDVCNIDGKNVFGLTVNIGGDEEDSIYFRIGYATKEEKQNLSERLKQIKKEKLNQEF